MTLHPKFYAGGYYLVQGNREVTDGLTAPLVTVGMDDCVIYPGTWALPWVTDTQTRMQNQQLLQLTDDEIDVLCLWVDAQMTDEEFGWPNVFTQVNVAREFYLRFLGALPKGSVHLLGLGLAEPYYSRFIVCHTPVDNIGPLGLYQNLLRKQPLESGGTFLGFDILYDHDGGDLPSFVHQMNLRQQFHDRLGITVNNHRMIDDWLDATRAATFADGGIEADHWFPWYVVDYPLVLATN
jgi:hypothetical protein